MKKQILTLNEFVDKLDAEVVWRNTSIKWLYDFLKKSKVKADKFISFSLAQNSGGMDNFGGTRIAFNRKELEKQGLVEIYYDSDFFEQYPDISLYVTGYKNEKDYYDNKDFDGPEDAINNSDFTWEEYIQDFEHEEELVIKSLKLTKNLIVSVEFVEDKPDRKTIELLNKNVIIIN